MLKYFSNSILNDISLLTGTLESSSVSTPSDITFVITRFGQIGSAKFGFLRLIIAFAPIAPFALLPTYLESFDWTCKNSAAAILVPCVKCTSSSPGVGALNFASDLGADCPPEGLHLFLFFAIFQMELPVPL